MIKEEIKSLPTRTKVLLSALVLVCVLGVTSVLVNWYKPELRPPQTFTKAPPISSLSSVPKKDIVIPKIKVYQKDVAAKKLPVLPTEVKDKVDVEITSSATTGPSKAGYNIVSTIDKNSGESSIYYKEKERSLLEFVNDKRVGVSYGISTDKGQPVGRVYGEWSFFRVGNAYVSAQVELRAKQLQQTEGVGSISIDYRW